MCKQKLFIHINLIKSSRKVNIVIRFLVWIHGVPSQLIIKCTEDHLKISKQIIPAHSPDVNRYPDNKFKWALSVYEFMLLTWFSNDLYFKRKISPKLLIIHGKSVRKNTFYCCFFLLTVVSELKKMKDLVRILWNFYWLYIYH